MPRVKKQSSGKWLQLRSGAVYHWSKSLAKASGAFVVGPQVAADWFRSIGAENEITKAYPPEEEVLAVADDDTAEGEPGPPLMPAARRRQKRQKKAPGGKLRSAAGREPTVAVSNQPATPKEIQDMIDGSDGG